MRNVSLAGNILLFLFGLLFIFHLLVLSGIFPYDIVWAGKISSREEMIRMESISLFLLAIAIMVVVLRMEYLPLPIPAKVNRIDEQTQFVNRSGGWAKAPKSINIAQGINPKKLIHLLQNNETLLLKGKKKTFKI